MTSSTNGGNEKESIDQDIEKIESYTDEGEEKLHKWYTTSKDERENVTGLHQPPHVSIANKAGELIQTAVDEFYGIHVFGKGGKRASTDIYYLLLTAGTERLLNAIMLKQSYQEFVNGSNYESPSFNSSRTFVSGNLPDSLSEGEEERVQDVLNLLETHRNHFAHFGYYSMTFDAHEPLIHNVLGFLFAEYFPEETEVVDLLRENSGSPKGWENSDVEFDY